MLQEAERVGAYTIDKPIGTGGMAVVYRARSADGSLVALKVLNPKLAGDARARRRFADEARTMARLNHPGVVRILDVGESDTHCWFAMELLPGGSLADQLKATGPLPPERAAEVVAGVLAVLDVAHRNGVIHRDVKPDNLLVDLDGSTRLTDFGIARAEDRTQSLTRTGSALGTWAYMAPEQRSNAKDVDGRADLFACGATLYALLTGRPPLDLTTQEVREGLDAEGIPVGLAAVIRRSTRYRPDDRYPSAAAMQEHLESLIPALRGQAAARAPVQRMDDGETFDVDSLEDPEPDSVLPSTPDTPDEPAQPILLLAVVAVTGVLLLTVGALWMSTEPEEESPAVAFAGIRLDCHPPGAVLVDGKFKARTPWLSNTSLSPGRHEVTLRTDSGDTQTFQVDGSKPVSLCWDFEADAYCSDDASAPTPQTER